MKCHNCNSEKLIIEAKEDELKYFCCVCGSDYMKYKDYLNDNALTEIKTYNIGVKIWKEVNVKEIKMSFISNTNSIQEFIDICHKGISQNKLEIAEYIVKYTDTVYIRYDIITNEKSYIRP